MPLTDWKRDKEKALSYKQVQMENVRCVCGASYKSQSGFRRHRKKCHDYIAINEYDNLVRDKDALSETIGRLVDEKNKLVGDNNRLIEDKNKLIEDLESANQRIDALVKQVNELNTEYREAVSSQLTVKDNQISAKDRQLEGAGNIIGSQGKSIIKMLHQYASDAPILKYTIDDDSMTKQIKGNHKNDVGMVLVDHFTEGDLPQILGEVIVAGYQEDDITKQSIWSTDVARLTYLIKDITKKGSIWTQDKKGNKVKLTIIKPLLLKIKGIVETFNNALLKTPVSEFRVRVEKEITGLIHDIGYKNGKNVSKLANKINQHVASRMHFDDKHKNKLKN